MFSNFTIYSKFAKVSEPADEVWLQVVVWSSQLVQKEALLSNLISYLITDDDMWWIKHIKTQQVFSIARILSSEISTHPKHILKNFKFQYYEYLWTVLGNIYVYRVVQFWDRVRYRLALNSEQFSCLSALNMEIKILRNHTYLNPLQLS